jgi:hypothetical protein
MSLCEVPMLFLLHPFRLFPVQCAVMNYAEHGIDASITAAGHDGL